MNNPFLDLYRDHGLLERILGIYEQWISLLDTSVSPSIIFRAAKIVRDCVESCHEKMEEKFIFPMTPGNSLVKMLKQQHAEGRILTDTIIQNVSNPFIPWRVVAAAKEFGVMYRRHMALENTQVFPEVAENLDADLTRELGIHFEVFGGDDDKVLKDIEALEKKLGILTYE